MNKNIIETTIGVLVILTAILFLNFASNIVGTKGGNTYLINAKFENIEGVSVGSDVKIGGIKIGEISNTQLDKKTYESIVAMKIQEGYLIPNDSNLKISSSGLLGGKFVKIEIGASDEYMEDNEFAEFTQSTIDLEDLISRFVFKGDK